VEALAFEATLGIFADSVLGTSSVAFISICRTLINIRTEVTVAFVTGVASTLDTRISRNTSGVFSADSIFGNRSSTMIDGFTNITVSNITFLASATITRLLIFTDGVRRARLGGTSYFKTFVDVHASIAISLVSVFTETRNARVQRCANSFLVANSKFGCHIQAIIVASDVNTEGRASVSVSVVALVTGTSDTGEERGTSGVS